MESDLNRKPMLRGLTLRGVLALVLGSLLLLGAPLHVQALSEDFYKDTCPSIHDIVAEHVKAALCADVSLGAALVRMHFHDCFVRGCDASLLLDQGSRGQQPEKKSVPNLTVLGFELIEEIKSRLEEACPEVVSCADIIGMAATSAICQLGGPCIGLRHGRRDGVDSFVGEAEGFPSPGSSAQDQLAVVSEKMGLELVDLVALSGAHTIGRAKCSRIQHRFSPPDETMDGPFREALARVCTPERREMMVQLDPATPVTFDNQYFKNLLEKKGLLTSDQAFALDENSNVLVEKFAQDQQAFFEQFQASYLKMSEVHVLESEPGQVRKVCSARN